MRFVQIGTIVGATVVLACTNRVEPSSAVGSTSAASTTESGLAPTTNADTTGADGLGTNTGEEPVTTGEETGGEIPACEFPGLPPVGQACTDEGSCIFGDFCALGIYECIDGVWEYRITHGCGARPVACEDSPEDNNGCDPKEETEACDPDGDCLDVLECIGGNWVEREVCNAIACPEANPGFGLPCDEPYWICPMELPCGTDREFRCSPDGYWLVVEGFTPCPGPISCDQGPVPGDACPRQGETCVYQDPQWDTVECLDGVWTCTDDTGPLSPLCG